MSGEGERPDLPFSLAAGNFGGLWVALSAPGAAWPTWVQTLHLLCSDCTEAVQCLR